jgi:hypothetical protein
MGIIMKNKDGNDKDHGFKWQQQKQTTFVMIFNK